MRKTSMKFAAAILFLLASLFLAACPTDTEDPAQVLDIYITAENDSLLTYDQVIITVYSKDSSFVQEVFNGKIENPKMVLGLKLDPKVGKEFQVSLVGIKGGKQGFNKVIVVVNNKASGYKDLPVDTIVIDPQMPEILVADELTATETEQVRVTVTIRNAKTGGVLSIKSSPPNAALDSSGVLTWTPGYSHGRSDPYPVVLVYSYSDKRVEKTLNIKVLNVNRAPKITPVADQKAKEGETLSFKIEAADEDADSLALTASSVPSGAQFTENIFTWKPSVGQAANYSIRFQASDGHDSVWIAVLVTVGDVDPPPPLTLTIVSPSRDTIVNVTPIRVTYVVNDIPHHRDVALKEGKTRISIDTTVAGRTAVDTLLVTLDTAPPGTPMVSGKTPVRTRTPTWTWQPGANGNGSFRHRLDSEDMAAGTVTKDTAFTPSKELDPGTHTLYVQERDDAGNWSLIGRHTIRIDTTRPSAPKVTVSPSSPSNNPTPTWSWEGSGEDVNGLFRFKLDNANLDSGATETRSLKFVVPLSGGLKEGGHTFYVQQQDSAGNWSTSGVSPMKIDLTFPSAPLITVEQGTPTKEQKPKWVWTRGANPGMGSYRFKLNDTALGTGATGTEASYFVPDSLLKEGTYTLYLQERDSAGNWSSTASKTVRVDITPPKAPTVKGPIFRTTNLTPTWKWSKGGGDGIGKYRIKLDDSVMTTGTTSSSDTQFTPTSDLIRATHTLYVQELDSAGNWSSSGSFSIKVQGLIGYVVGWNGQIFKSINGGYSWEELPGPPTKNNYYSVHFPTPSYGYAVAYNGFVDKTVNGGAAWENLQNTVNLTMFSVYFTDANTGYAAGDYGNVWKTTDGGISWQILEAPWPQNGGGFLFAVTFSNSTTGYAGGFDGTIIKTTDAGKSWKKLSTGAGGAVLNIQFLDSDHGFAITDSGEVLKTLDAGASWSISKSGFIGTATSIQFVDINTGFIAFGSAIYKTVDGGKSWIQKNSTAAAGLRAITFLDANIGLAAGASGQIFRTINGGEAWTHSGYSTTEEFRSIHFP